MIKITAVAALLTLSAAGGLSATEFVADATAVPSSSKPGATDYRCFDATGAGLSGALQIDEGTRASDPAAPEHEVERGSWEPHCALV